jgi:hypothetical protein
LPVPDDETAALLSTIIDYGRFASGWNRLPETEQFGMVCAFYLDLTDAGVPRERWTDCYRAWKRRRLQALKNGKPTGPLSADDLILEWDSIRHMHAELDKTRLLTANAANACPKCYGTNMERMPNGSVRPGCLHEGWSPEFEEEIEHNEEARRAEIKKQADFMKDALSKVGSPKPVADAPKPKQAGTVLRCTNEACARKVTTLYGFEPGQSCNELLNRGVHDGPLKSCDGTLEAAS